ncbi:MAG: transposase [Clostridiales bacterium]|nr:transposase [Clostridiales bacterium]
MRDARPESFVYIDETGIDTFLHREYAYSKRGEKVTGRISGKKYRRLGIVAAKMGEKIMSPFQFNGTMDGRLFEFWFKNCLLRKCPSNSVIVMDNAAFHRKKRLISLAESSKHKIVFLPPYSPEYNPIENFLAWLKRKLRKDLSYFDSFDDCLRYCYNSI